jgi:hypothetical protein
LTLAADYFPRLQLHQGRIHYLNNDQTLTQLESDASTMGLMNYLNPTLLDIENQETICAARMVHWAQQHPQNRLAPVSLAVEFQAHMPRYHRRLGLDLAPAKVCLVFCDILHQGRTTFDWIAAALDTKRVYANLLTIGMANYAECINSLKRKINEAVQLEAFTKTYNAGTNRFM